jgi:Putative Flp pilus-assembly TadE/G-like
VGRGLLKALRRLRSNQEGQSLVIVAVSMTVVMGIAAFGIDVASWYGRYHHDQVVADAAALAAANCLANPGAAAGAVNGTAVPTCTSTTDTADAQTVAVDYAAANGLTITAANVNVNTTSGKVTVQAASNSPSFFAKVFGIKQTTQSASASAGFVANVINTVNSGSGGSGSTTTTPGGSSTTPGTTVTTPNGTVENVTYSACTASNQAQCPAIYAASTACTGTYPGVTIGTPSSGGAQATVTGTIHSEGAMSFSNTQVTASGLTIAGKCYTTMPSVQEVNSGTKLTAVSVASQPWPVNYAATPYFTACTTNCITVSGIANVPPYCTQATTSSSGFTFTNINGNPELPANNNVYCSIGSGNPKDPSTWNGPFNFQAAMPVNNQDNSGYSSCPGYQTDTFIGGTDTFLGAYGGGFNSCMKAYLNNCLIYSTGNVVIENSGGFFWSGDIFDPGGTIQLGSANSGGLNTASPSGLLEGLNFLDLNATLKLVGDGQIATVATTTTTSTSTTSTTTTTPSTTTTTSGTTQTISAITTTTGSQTTTTYYTTGNDSLTQGG